MDNIAISRTGGTYVYARNIHAGRLRKSAAARDRELVATQIVRLVQVGRDQMTITEKYINGNVFHAMLPRPVEMFCSPATRTAIREALILKSADMAAEFDAGRGREADVLNALSAVEKSDAVHDDGEGEGEDRDADGNLIVAEPFHKGGNDPELLRKAYKSAAGDGAISLREATAELDLLVEQFNKGGR